MRCSVIKKSSLIIRGVSRYSSKRYSNEAYIYVIISSVRVTDKGKVRGYVAYVFYFLHQELISCRYSSCSCCSCSGEKPIRLRRFKWDLDEIWQNYSSRKYTSTDGVEFSIWRHSFNMAAMTSFHAENSCCLVAEDEASGQEQFLINSSWKMRTYFNVLNFSI